MLQNYELQARMAAIIHYKFYIPHYKFPIPLPLLPPFFRKFAVCKRLLAAHTGAELWKKIWKSGIGVI